MNIKEAVEILKMWNKAEELVINESTDYDKTVYIQRKEAIETLLIAYEKEKEKNKEILSGNIENFQKYFLEEFDKKFISKDKILEILGIEETDSEKILSLLQTIVDENARLEDIEDKKVQIEYNDVFNKGVKSVEDKIKAKIEELEIEQESNREDLKIAIDNLLFQNIDKIGNRISINMSVREILQSLLEKE